MDWILPEAKRRPASRSARLQWRPLPNTSDLDAFIIVLPLLEEAAISFVGRIMMKAISLDCRQLPLFIQTPTAPGAQRQSTLLAKLTMMTATARFCLRRRPQRKIRQQTASRHPREELDQTNHFRRREYKVCVIFILGEVQFRPGDKCVGWRTFRQIERQGCSKFQKSRQTLCRSRARREG
jgi:hypothetical protein